ncbi:MAG: hypothetical protein VST67_10875 [Nitrospirota bacterium]|nr:hypothetical protein [Nitrospirota bacterium]
MPVLELFRSIQGVGRVWPTMSIRGGFVLFPQTVLSNLVDNKGFLKSSLALVFLPVACIWGLSFLVIEISQGAY